MKAEVVPDEKAMQKAALTKDFADDPAAPLKVKLWTDKQDMGDKVRGITITGKQGKASTAEFYEETQSIRTIR